MKLLLALATISCLILTSTAYSEELKSIPIEDQGPTKDNE